MGYDLHLRRGDPESPGERLPISLDEWLAAAQATPGVRLSSKAEHRLGPPGHELVLRAREGDAELRAENGEFFPAFRWSEGAITFSSRCVDSFDRSDPGWAAAVALAHQLDAEIVGDEGERYDLETGEVIPAPDEELEELEPAPPGSEELTVVLPPRALDADRALPLVLALLQEAHAPMERLRINGMRFVPGRGDDVARTYGPELEMEGDGWSCHLGEDPAHELSSLSATSAPRALGDWSSWLDALSAATPLVLAWVADREYQARQAMAAFELRELRGGARLAEPRVPDPSRNPGCTIRRRGYVEAIGARMWLGPTFWKLTGADPQDVHASEWLQVTRRGSVVELRALDACFTGSDGPSGALQRKLRALLYPCT